MATREEIIIELKSRGLTDEQISARLPQPQQGEQPQQGPQPLSLEQNQAKLAIIEQLKELSYLKYGRDRAEIEAEIMARYSKK